MSRVDQNIARILRSVSGAVLLRIEISGDGLSMESS